MHISKNIFEAGFILFMGKWYHSFQLQHYSITRQLKCTMISLKDQEKVDCFLENGEKCVLHYEKSPSKTESRFILNNECIWEGNSPIPNYSLLQ